MIEYTHIFDTDPIEHIGVASSDWQLNPVIGEGDDASDWGREYLYGHCGDDSVDKLPRFDQNYDKVIRRVKEVNGNTFRVSIDFARLCPSEGVFNEDLMNHYIRVLAKCHFYGIKPMVTLNHWTLPASFGKYDGDKIVDGPLEHPGIVKHFEFYVNHVADFLFDPSKIRNAIKDEGYDDEFVEFLCDDKTLVQWFISLNEPINMIVTPYIVGEFPPYKKGRIDKYFKFIGKLREMHRISYEVMHNVALTRRNIDVKVGIAHQVMDNYVPLFNWGLLERMEDGSMSDFLGLQYYFKIRLALASGGKFSISGNNPCYQCDHPEFGAIYPEGMYNILKKTSSLYPSKELIVTEMGFADASDYKRPYWILDTVYHLLRAKREGVNVTGALLWSIIDNFEWRKGMSMKFGIFDKDGNRKIGDNGSYISSRMVWGMVSKHLTNPTHCSGAALSGLRNGAKKQLKDTC